MNVKQLNKKLKFTKDQLKSISDAVHQAEKKTSGEIALAITPESSTYAVYELLCAVLSGIICFSVMVPYAQDIQSWLFSFLWIEKSWILPLFMETVSIGFSLLFYFIFNTPFFDRLIVPKAVQKRNVYNRALRYFTESGIYSTQNHTGILIFTSWVERSIYILADDGIAKKIPQQTWNEIAFKISTGFLVGKASSITEAYLEAIKQCGDLLAEHFPAENNNPNELKDNLDIVGDGLVMFNEN